MNDELLATLRRLLLIPDLHSQSQPFAACGILIVLAEEVAKEELHRSDQAKAALVTFGPKKRGAK